MRPARLSVNVDHVATLRQARGVDYPSPVEAALAAERAGAAGITVHLRSDRRHVQDSDVREIVAAIGGKMNFEMAVTEEMLAIALECRPHQASLVPESPDEVTTEGGLDLGRAADAVAEAAHRLDGAGIAVSLFLDPDMGQLERMAALPAPIRGYEINTDRFTRAAGPDGSGDARIELEAIATAAAWGPANGFEVYAGHGLTAANVGPVAALPQIREFNIGHWLVSRSVIVGLAGAVREMLAAIAAGKSRR